MSDYGDSYRLGPFREFYAEIIRLKQIASEAVWTSPSARAALAPPPDDAPQRKANISTALVRAEPGGNGSHSTMEFLEPLQPTDSSGVGSVVWHRLVSLFQHQAITAWKNGGTHGAELYKDAQYVMIVLADEIFLHMVNWEGKSEWDSNLLEAKILRSHAGGQVFFDNLNRLLREKNPRFKDLAAVYLMALSLGFEGMYRGLDDRGKLAQYRRELFIFIYGREPELHDERRYLFPEAYRHSVREEQHRKLSDPRRWLVVLALVIIVYVGATQALWVQFTQKLNTVNQSITKIVGELKAQP
jgi:type VI secretion system protein ImpK